MLNVDAKRSHTTAAFVAKVTALALRVFDQCKPQILLIEKPVFRRSPALLCMTVAITVLARRRRITVIELTRQEMQDIFSPAGTRLTKAMLCQAIDQHYSPRLTHYFRKTTRSAGDKEPYFYAPFMAIALELAWFKKYRVRK